MSSKSENKHFKGINKKCCVPSAYNFTTTTATAVGHIKALAFINSNVTLKADTVVKDPENPDSDVNVVGVIEQISWKGGQTDSVSVMFRTSEANAADISKATFARKGGPEVKMSFDTWGYNFKDKQFFKTFGTDDKEVIFELTKNTEVDVADKPDSIIQKPHNFTVVMHVTPNSEAGIQSFSVAFAPLAKEQIDVGVASAG
jgi:hypothetical protein